MKGVYLFVLLALLYFAHAEGKKTDSLGLFPGVGSLSWYNRLNGLKHDFDEGRIANYASRDRSNTNYHLYRYYLEEDELESVEHSFLDDDEEKFVNVLDFSTWMRKLKSNDDQVYIRKDRPRYMSMRYDDFNDLDEGLIPVLQNYVGWLWFDDDLAEWDEEEDEGCWGLDYVCAKRRGKPSFLENKIRWDEEEEE